MRKLRPEIRHPSSTREARARFIGRRPVAVYGLLFAAYSFLALPTFAAFTADLSNGDVSIKLEATPDKVSPAHDLMVSLTVEAPANLAVALPDLRDRFSGFSTAEDFVTDPVEANGRTRQTHRWKLTPEPAAPRYRLAPFAVETGDRQSPSAPRTAFATKPVLFPSEGARPVVTGDPEVTPVPDWIPPTAKTVALWIVFVVFGLAAGAAAVFGLTRLSRRVREFRLSPMERAMAELQRLLGRNLPSRGLYKEFYIELTMVVRRYIERTHGIRAPEQTTQEFLEAAAHHSTFTGPVIAQLRTFLESADLVKFAGQEATPAMSEDATAKARTYIEKDAAEISSNRIDASRPASGPVDSRRNPTP